MGTFVWHNNRCDTANVEYVLIMFLMSTFLWTVLVCVPFIDVKKWGIVGIGLMPWDSKMYNILKEQDHLYTLLSRGHTGSEARVVGSIVDFMFAPEDHQAVIDKVRKAPCSKQCGGRRRYPFLRNIGGGGRYDGLEYS